MLSKHKRHFRKKNPLAPVDVLVKLTLTGGKIETGDAVKPAIP